MPPNALINRGEEEKMRAKLVPLEGGLEVEASRARAKSGHEVDGVGDLGLDVVREVVSVRAGEDDAAGHGSQGTLGPHLLDVVLVSSVDNGGDVEEGLASVATEGDLAEHAVGLGLALSDGVEVADVVVREGDGDVLGVVAVDRSNLSVANRGGEVDGALDIVKGPEGDGGGVGGGGSGDEAGDHGRELHLERRSGFGLVVCWKEGGGGKKECVCSRLDL